MRSFTYLFIITALAVGCSSDTEHNNTSNTTAPMDSALNGNNGNTSIYNTNAMDTLDNPAGMNKGEGTNGAESPKVNSQVGHTREDKNNTGNNSAQKTQSQQNNNGNTQNMDGGNSSNGNSQNTNGSNTNTNRQQENATGKQNNTGNYNEGK